MVIGGRDIYVEIESYRHVRLVVTCCSCRCLRAFGAGFISRQTTTTTAAAAAGSGGACFITASAVIANATTTATTAITDVNKTTRTSCRSVVFF